MVLKERFTNNFDFLRVFAALCIAFSHSYALLDRYNEEPLQVLTGKRFDFSFIGLSIFFSISGYLITKSALNSPSLKNFLWKRFLRIQPLLIAVCIITVFLIGPIFTTFKVSEYFKNLHTYAYFRNVFPATGLQFSLPGVFETNIKEASTNGSLWTLVVEERLYILTIAVYLLKAKRKNYYLAFILFYNIIYMINNSFGQFSTGYLLKGATGYYALVFLNAGGLFLSGFRYQNFEISGLLAIVLIGLLSFSVPQLGFLQVIMVPVLILIGAQLKSFLNKAGRFGDFTYGLYVFAFPVQQSIIALNQNKILPYTLFVYTILICLPLSIVSWHIFEKKMLLMKNRVV